MKLFKPKQNFLFVDEESYNWSSSKASVSRRILSISVLLICAGFLFIALS